MDDKTDATTLILRFIFGAVLGGLLTLIVLWIVILLGDPKLMRVILMIGGLVTLLIAICAAIWGDRFLVAVIKIFRIFKYFP